MRRGVVGVDGSGKTSLGRNIEGRTEYPVIYFPSCEGSTSVFARSLGGLIKGFLDRYQDRAYENQEVPSKFIVTLGYIASVLPCFIARRRAPENAVLIRDSAIDSKVYGSYYLPWLKKPIRGLAELLFGEPEKIVYLVRRPNDGRPNGTYQIHNDAQLRIYQLYARELDRYKHARIVTKDLSKEEVFEEFNKIIQS